MKRNTKKGFTLVELLVVIAILGVLATVGIVGYSSYTTKAKQVAAQTELGQIKTQILADDIENANFEIKNNEMVFAFKEYKYEKTNDTELNGTKTYYTLSGTTYSKVENSAVADIANYYERSDVNYTIADCFTAGAVTLQTNATLEYANGVITYTAASGYQATWTLATDVVAAK